MGSLLLPPWTMSRFDPDGVEMRGRFTRFHVGGNGAVQQYAQEWAADHARCRVIFHNWWNAPLTWAKVQAIDPVASHGSWMENFPWTRLPGVDMPATQRPMVDIARVLRRIRCAGAPWSPTPGRADA